MKRLLLLSIMALAGNALADQLNPLATLPWQVIPSPVPYYYSYPYQSWILTVDHVQAAEEEVATPVNPGKLFATINWFQHLDNLNVGSALEYTNIYLGVVWWDFQGGHSLMDSHLNWHTNKGLPLRLSYLEFTSGYPGPNYTTWFKPPSTPWGYVQYEPIDQGGWVTQVKIYTRDVPDSGSTIWLTLAALACILWMRRLA